MTTICKTDRYQNRIVDRLTERQAKRPSDRHRWGGFKRETLERRRETEGDRYQHRHVNFPLKRDTGRKEAR